MNWLNDPVTGFKLSMKLRPVFSVFFLFFFVMAIVDIQDMSLQSACLKHVLGLRSKPYPRAGVQI
jgi:hypothetical protein